MDYSKINLEELEQRDFLDKEVRDILLNCGRLLKKTGKPRTEFMPTLKAIFQVGGQGFAKGAAAGTVGIDPMMVDPNDVIHDRTKVIDGKTVQSHGLPIAEAYKERARYYYNLGLDLIEYSQNARSRLRTNDLAIILRAFNELLDNNLSEYKTVVELAHKLSIISDERLNRYLNAPANITSIDLHIRERMKKAYFAFSNRFLRNTKIK